MTISNIIMYMYFVQGNKNMGIIGIILDKELANNITSMLLILVLLS